MGSALLLLTIFILWSSVEVDSAQSQPPNTKLRPRRIGETLWINATFKAEDAGLNLSVLCHPIIEYWNAEKQQTLSNQELLKLSTNQTFNHSLSLNETKVNLTEPEPLMWVHNKTIAKTLSLNTTLLDEYGAVVINLGHVCQLLPRVLWINQSSDAKQYGLNTTVICIPFRQTGSVNATELEDALKVLAANDTDDDSDPNHRKHKNSGVTKKRRVGRAVQVTTPAYNLTTTTHQPNQSAAGKGLQLNVSNGEEAVLIVKDPIGAEKLDLDPSLLDLYESIGIDLPTACKEEKHQTLSAFNASEQLGVSVDQNIGVDVNAIDGNLEELQEIAKNDTELDNIIKDTNGTNEPTRMLPGSFITALTTKAKYDKYSSPALFENQTVVVKVGFYVESISDFDSQSMDYQMDIYLHMAWRDPRLKNSKLNSTINIKEQEIRDLLWLPDAYFPNSKKSEFHEVTFLNFVMHVRPSGEVLYIVRVKLNPSCHLVLCKFPHDVQQCSLKIQSFAYPNDQVRFEWFSDLDEAVDLNPDILFSELSIDRATGRRKSECDGSSKIGNYTCLEATFTLTRDLGYYIAQMYVPTTLALMFSWVGVWLPEELMEGRLSVAITVLLTLSTDSVSSQEHLPTVSYMKAIDIWFAFITAFVFLTMVQTLFVIGFDRKALTLRKRANRKFENPDDKAHLETLAERYHKLGRYLDKTCRLAYPLTFLCFCAVYFFVITQGAQDSCVSKK